MQWPLFAACATAALAAGAAEPSCGTPAVTNGAAPCGWLCDASGGGGTAWKLFGELPGGVELAGWASGGFTSNAAGNRSGNGNAPLPYNNVSDGPVLNQLWFYAQRRADTGTQPLDWGFRADVMFGSDGPDTRAVGDGGWDFDWSRSRDYGAAFPQLYAEVAAGDLSVLAGYFFSPEGYENTPAPENFFYSHSYAFGAGTPNTRSGFLASYTAGDHLVLDAGWTTGWDSWWSNHLGASTFLGGVTWMWSESTQLEYFVTAGDFGDGTAAGGRPSHAGRIYSHVIDLQYAFAPGWTWVCQHTFGSNSGLGANNQQWSSLGNYLLYDINDCVAAGARIEAFRDSDGGFVEAGAGPGTYYEATLGLNLKPHANVRIRPEVRWDWFAGRGQPFDIRAGSNTGTAVSLFTGGLDAVVTF